MVGGRQIAYHQMTQRQMTWVRGMERRGFTIHWIDATQPTAEKVAIVRQLLAEEETSSYSTKPTEGT